MEEHTKFSKQLRSPLTTPTSLKKRVSLICQGQTKNLKLTKKKIMQRRHRFIKIEYN